MPGTIHIHSRVEEVGNGVKKEILLGCTSVHYDMSIGNDPEQIATYEQDLVSIEVAQRIYDLR